MAKLEEEFMGVLQILEFALIQSYRANDEMTDWEAETAVSGLIRTYTAEQRKRPAPATKMQLPVQQAYTDLQIPCEGWLGRGPLLDETGQTVQVDENNKLTISEIIACLKRIRRSIEMWQKEGGRRGYFEFIDQFLPE